MPVLSGSKAADRGRELQPIRERVRKLWEDNPLLFPTEVRDILISEGAPPVSVRTIAGWMKGWRSGQRTERRSGKPTMTMRQPLSAPAVLSLESLVSACGSIEIVEQLLLEAVWGKIQQSERLLKDAQSEVMAQRDKILELEKERTVLSDELNTVKAKVRLSRLQLVNGKIVPRE